MANAGATELKPLIIRLRNWVGEVVLALPTLTLLQRSGYQLHLVGKPWARELLAAHGWPVHVRPRGTGAAIAQLRQLRLQSRIIDPQFDAQTNALLLTESFSSAFEARLAGLRPVGATADFRSLLLSKSIRIAESTHMAQRFWQVGSLLAALDALPAKPAAYLLPDDGQNRAARDLLQSRNLLGPYAVLCPFSGAGDPDGRKRWPAFRELPARLRARGLGVLICPGPGETEIAAREFPRELLAENVSLGVCAALMRDAFCTIANDTGPGHIAAAVGARLLSLYGPGSAARWTPVGPDVTVLRPEGRWSQLDEVLAELPGPPTSAQCR